MKVHHVLSLKGKAVHSISPGTTVLEALKIMADKNLSALLVLDKDKIAGIFTERDYARKVILQGKHSNDTLVMEVMHVTPLLTVTEDTEVAECMNIMTNKFVRHLPVMKGDELVGIISIGDVVKAIISDQQSTIESLHTYISGGRDNS